ncbi:hypothetical protein DAMA08_028790 [Martiniozyma asiatica (nom. inval.)]|nr:hypothetical protein DAMA08_028790 [Martiniozyma asiatica]
MVKNDFESLDLSNGENINIYNAGKFNFTKHSFACFLCILISFGGFIFGWDTGTISGFVNMPSYKELLIDSTGGYSSTKTGLIVSSLNIGCAIGGILLSWMSDYIGIRGGLGLTALPYLYGVASQLTLHRETKKSWITIVVGRILSGIGIGGISCLAPMLIAEISPSMIRGRMVSCYQLMITLGILSGYWTNYNTVKMFEDCKQWETQISLCILWGLLFIISNFIVPESPRYFVKQKKFIEARKAIAYVNRTHVNSELTESELGDILSAVEKETNERKGKWSELFTGRPHLLVRLLLGIALQSFQQLTGNNFFFYYGTFIFKSVGFENSFLTSIIIGIVNFGSTIVAICIADMFGRRTTLISGAIMMLVCLLCFSIIGTSYLYPQGYNMPPDQTYGYIMIVLTCVFIFSFATTWAPCVFVVVSEIYPLRLRSKGMAIATSANWIWGFIISMSTPAIIDKFRFGCGYIFFGACFFAAIVVFLMLPETKGFNLDNIDDLYSHYEPFMARKARSDYERRKLIESGQEVLQNLNIVN